MCSLIDVKVTTENTEEIILLAKVFGETDTTYKVKFLNHINGNFYDYDSEIEEIEKETVCGFYDSNDEKDAGFSPLEGGGFECMDDDEDYEPSEEEDDEDDEDDEDEDEDEDDDDEEDFLE